MTQAKSRRVAILAVGGRRLESSCASVYYWLAETGGDRLAGTVGGRVDVPRSRCSPN